jgi:low density lipoprotein-related protein 2
VDNVVATTSDMINNVIYWSDMDSKKIMKMKRGESAQALIESGLSLVEGLAYDWVAENLYWLDSKLNSIQVSILRNFFGYFFIFSHLILSITDNCR